MLLDSLMRVVINGVAFAIVVEFVPGIHVHPPTDLVKLALLALIFGLVNAYLRPIVKTLSLPLNLLSFGLVGLILNVALVMLAAFVGNLFDLGLKLGGWPPGPIVLNTLVAAFVLSLLIGLVAAAVALVRRLTPGI